MQKETKNERDVMRIMIWGTAVAFGFMAGALQVASAQARRFHFLSSRRSPLAAFLVGTGIVLGFWKIILNRASNARQKSLRFATEVVLLLLGMGAFLYPLRYGPSERLPDMFTGLITAASSRSLLLAALLVMTGKFLESDDKRNRVTSENAEAPPDGTKASKRKSSR